MNQKGRLLAAVTASGAILCLTVPAQGSTPVKTGDIDKAALSRAAEAVRTKVRALAPAYDGGSADDKIDNVVQFYNFLNR